MINPAGYTPEIWVFVYPKDGGPELRYMQFGTHEAAEIQQEVYIQSCMEGWGEEFGDEEEEKDFYRSSTLIIRVNTASLNIQQIILDLVCNPNAFDTEDEYVMAEFIERLLPDYDPAMYKYLLETQWDELKYPQYPHDIRAESSDQHHFPPFSVRTDEDDWLDGGFKTIEETLEFCRIRMTDAVNIGRIYDLVLCIQNGHENTIESYDIESWRDYD